MESDRSEKLLALLLIGQMKGSTTQKIITQLSLAGFSNVEIADLLQTTSAFVSQALYMNRKGPSGKAPSRVAKKSLHSK